jgi:hypothetical protein
MFGTAPRGSTRKPAALLFVILALCGCGKKGPPLAPLNLVPEPPAGLTAKRVGSTVYLQMNAPAKNANGPGPAALDRVEIFAVTVGVGFAAPANRDLLTPTYRIGEIAIKPPPDPDEEPTDETENDPRPGAGDRIAFHEALTEKQLESAHGLKPLPATGSKDENADHETRAAETELVAMTDTPLDASQLPGGVPLPVPPTAGGGPSEGAAAPVQEKPPTVPVRVYIARGVTRKGRPGTATARFSVPLVAVPPAPSPPSLSFNERAIAVVWIAPVQTLGSSSSFAFNVYRRSRTPASAQPTAESALPAPLNGAPVSGTTFEQPGAQPGIEQCFEVRTVEKAGAVLLESDASPPACVTPRDIFPPAAPKGLALVAMDGGIMNLIWDANSEPDLAGYLVLRGESPGDTLQPLTLQPIRATRYTDTTAKPGIRYVYAVVAVDRATPPNRSAPSLRVEETAR